MDLGFAALRALTKYGVWVILGLVIHAGVTLSLLVWFIGRYSPIRLFKAVLPAIMTAWSTASSAATLPLTMDCLHRRAGVDRRIGNFVIRIGSRMDLFIRTIADKDGNQKFEIQLRDSYIGGIETLAEALEIAGLIIEENKQFIES